MISKSEEETLKIAGEFAAGLPPGSVLALEGDLGSGKTTFVKGLAVGLGIADGSEVTSPTFAIMNIYRAKVPVYHFDLYRLENSRQIQEIGFDEFMDDTNAIKCIEWAERCRDLLPAGVYTVRMKVISEEEREIILPEI